VDAKFIHDECVGVGYIASPNLGQMSLLWEFRNTGNYQYTFSN